MMKDKTIPILPALKMSKSHFSFYLSAFRTDFLSGPTGTHAKTPHSCYSLLAVAASGLIQETISYDIRPEATKGCSELMQSDCKGPFTLR